MRLEKALRECRVCMNDDVQADPRVLLAAEQTLLAWLRTGISFITFGFVIALGLWLAAHETGATLPGAGWMGGFFGALGAIANVVAVIRYVAIRRAMLQPSEAPSSLPAMLFFAGSVAFGGILLSAVVFRFLL
jgi:uncharacterized membrane protein YidH (DUF202 family)